MECHRTKLKAYLLTIADHELVQYGHVLSKPIVNLQSQFLLAEIPYIYCAVCLNIEEGPHPIFFYRKEQCVWRGPTVIWTCRSAAWTREYKLACHRGWYYETCVHKMEVYRKKTRSLGRGNHLSQVETTVDRKLEKSVDAKGSWPDLSSKSSFCN